MLHAVVVGIDRYQDRRIPDLSFARADAEAVAQLIEERISPSERRVHLLADADATKHNLMVTIGEELPRLAGPEDIVMLFAACHGSPESASSPDRLSRYLITSDTEYDRIYATGIDMERELPRWFERIVYPRLVVMFVDACFSGRAGGRTFEGPLLAKLRAQFRGVAPISLRKLDLGEGRLMIGACDDDQVAEENEVLGHGVFTHFLMNALMQPGVGPTRTVHAVYDNVAREVRAYTGGRQIPVINGRSRFAQLPNLA